MLYMQRKNVVEEVEDPALEISLEEAEKLDSALQVGDIRTDSGTLKRVWAYCDSECKEPDSSKNKRRRKKSCI